MSSSATAAFPVSFTAFLFSIRPPKLFNHSFLLLNRPTLNTLASLRPLR